MNASFGALASVTPGLTQAAVNKVDLRQATGGGNFSVLTSYSCTVEYDGSVVQDVPCIGTLTAPLSVGTYELYFHAYTVGAAQGGDSGHVFVTVATDHAPTVSISSPANGARIVTASGSASLTLTAAGADVDNNLVSVSASIDGAAASLSGATSISSVISLAVGHHTFSVTALDASGVSATSSVGFDILADAAPTATLQSPANGAQFQAIGSTTAVSVQGTGGDPDAVGTGGEFDHLSLTVDNVANATSSTTSLSTSLTLAPGAHSIVLTATDKMGLTTSSTSNITVLADHAPQGSLSSPTSGHVYTVYTGAPATVSVVGVMTDPDSGSGDSVTRTEVWLDGASVGSFSGGSVNTTINASGAGSHAVKLHGFDTSNTAGDSPTVNFTIATLGPIVGNVDGVYYDTTSMPMLEGWACDKNVAASVNVAIYAGGPSGTGTQIGTVTANLASEAAIGTTCGTGGANYRWSFPLSSLVASRAGQTLYVYGISAQNGGAQTLLANSGNVNVPAIGGPRPVTVSPPNLAGGLAGTLPGHAGVSSRGASQYSFSFPVPPGTAGMAPSLGLSYDSENPIDIGGLGWSLTGLSTITRCKRTLATDNHVHPVDLTAADAYCLNGERLVNISGTDGAAAEYRTEEESFQRVKSFGSNTAAGPDYWTVETRDGRILTIGGGSATVSVTKAGNVVNWMWTLAREQDQHGNYMTVAYESTTTGERFPTQILYTGNTAAGLVPYNSVDFIYEARSDVFSGYVSDVLVTRPNRLKQIRTRVGVDGNGNGGSVARQWNFAYNYSAFSNRSLLQSVTDCNGDGSQCLPATTFAWTQRDPSKNTWQASTGTWPGPGIPLQAAYAVNSATYEPAAQFAKRAVVADFDGDGKTDLLFNAAGSSSWTLCSGLSTSCVSLPGMPAVSSENFLVGDFNGDGLPDVLVAAGGGTWDLCLSLGKSFSCSQISGLPASTTYVNSPAPLIGDFDGDGRDDLMFSSALSPPQGMLCTSTGVGFTCRAYDTTQYGILGTTDPTEKTKAGSQVMADFDGDGQIDILAYQTSSSDLNCHTTPTDNCIYDTTQFYRFSFGPTGLVSTSSSRIGTGGFFAGVVSDLNGDGVTDLMFNGRVVRHDASGNVTSDKSYLDTCFGGTVCTAVSEQTTDFSYSLFSAGDLLQTGASAGLYGTIGNVSVVPFNADGTQGSPSTSMTWTLNPTCPATTSMQLSMDLDGDGIKDTLCYTPNALPSGAGTWTYALSGSNSFADRLQSVTDGNGLKTTWTYTSGNDPTVVFSGTRGVYPTKNVRVNGPVVSKMSVDADSSQTVGQTLDTTYTYSGMRSDNRGRGSLGFDTVNSTEVATGVVTTTQYSQSFPTIARTISVTKTGGGCTLYSAVSTWASFATQTGVLYPYVRTQGTTGQDLDCTWLPQTTMQVGTLGGNDGIDAYGNVNLAITSSVENNGTGDSYSVVDECTDFDNRVGTQWVLGLCRTAYRIAYAPLSSPIQRQVSSVFDSFGALQSSTSMPGTALALTTSYVLDPNLGVPTSIMKSWTDPLPPGAAQNPTTSMTYDSAWRFPITVKNALGQVETLGYDAATGVETSLVDYNNLTTSWKVDAWGRHTEEDRPDGTYSTFAYKLCVDTCGSLAKTVQVVQHWALGPVQMLSPEETFLDSRGRKLLYRTWNDANAEADTTWSYGDMGDLYSQTLSKYAADAATGTTTNSVIDILHRPKRVDRTNAAGTGVDTTLYAYSALKTTTTDANLHTRIEQLNALGKVKTVTDNNAQAVNYHYNGFGDLLIVADPAGNGVDMAYDAMGHKISMKDPDLGSWSYVVDAAGRTRQQTDAKSQVTTYTYDPLNRLTERLEPDLDSHWTFDTAANGVGMLAESYTWIAATSTKDYRRVYAYDSVGRPSSSTTTLDWDYTQLNTYDSFGHLATVTHRRSAVGAANVANNPADNGQLGLPQIQYALGYNSRGDLSSVVRGSSVLWMLNTRDAAGRTTLASLSSGLMTYTHYNTYTSRLDMIQTGPSNGAGGVNPSIQSDSYDYDPVGNLLHRYWLPSTGAAQMSETFTYDALDRLFTAQVSGLDIKNFGYDALGDIKSKTNVGSYTYPAAGSAWPHLVSNITGTVAGLTNPSFAYDANGNLQNGLNRWYTWSAANLPFSVDQLTNGTQVSATLRHEFLYGTERDRTREIVRAMSGTTIGSVQRTIYSTESIEKEIDAVAGTTKIRTYLPLGLGFTEEDFSGTSIVPTAIGTPAERYYHKDNLGSPDIVTDTSQTVLERMAYDAWGRRRQSNGLEVDWQSLSAQSASNTLDHKGYTDQEQLDDLSLVHLNGRVYDPMTGRFTSPDPTIQDPFDLQSLNRASYVRNSPMDRVDPTGFRSLCQMDSYCDVQQVAQPAQGGTGTAGGAKSATKQTTNGQFPLQPKSAAPQSGEGAKGKADYSGGNIVKNMAEGAANLLVQLFGTPPPTVSHPLPGSPGPAFQPDLPDAADAGRQAAGLLLMGRFGAAGDAGVAASEIKAGSFSIVDWSGYPSGVPQPTGLFRLIEGDEYDAARSAANAANREMRQDLSLVGKPVDVHEVKPVKFGGSPTDAANKVVLPRDLHRQEVTPWWNQMMRDIADK